VTLKVRRVAEISYILYFYLDISADIVVYRFSPTKLNEYLRKKIAHLVTCSALDSRTIVRELAKDGLMEDGREDLLHRTLTQAFFSSSQHFLQLAAYVHAVTYSPSIYRQTSEIHCWPHMSKPRRYHFN
jgi:hypothetical protein